MSIGNAKTPSANVVSSTLSANGRKKINEMNNQSTSAMCHFGPQVSLIDPELLPLWMQR